MLPTYIAENYKTYTRIHTHILTHLDINIVLNIDIEEWI